MTIEEILAKTEDAATKTALKQLIKNERHNAEEAQKIVTKAHEDGLKSLGYDTSKHTSIDAFVTAKKNEIKAVSTQADGDKTEAGTLRTEVEELRNIISADKSKLATNSMTTALTTKFGKEFKGSEFIIKDLVSSGRAKTGEDGSITVDGSSLEDALAKLKKDHPELVAVKIAGGTGDTGGDGVDDPEEDAKKDEFDKQAEEILGL